MAAAWTPSGVFAARAYGTMAGTLFVAFLVTACVSDLRVRRIPNRLVLWFAVLGLLYSVATHPWRVGAMRAGEGLALGLALWFPFYLMHWIGAGDVKLFAAASAWLGAALALRAAVLAALIGGAFSLVWMIAAQGWWVTLVRVRYGLIDRPDSAVVMADATRRRRIPYGVAMAAGLIAAAWLPRALM